MIIDAHAHVWPPDIARKVLADRPVGLDAVADGTLDGLAKTMDAAGIDRCCCLGVALAARTVEKTNEFIGSVDRQRFIPFGTIHPDLPVDDNMRSLADNGIGAIKVHPIFQKLSLSDPRVREILSAVAEAGMAVLTHAGAGGEGDDSSGGSPAQVLALSSAIPTLKLIACHYGGYHQLDDAENELVGSSVILETSWPPSIADLDGDRLRSIIERHGADRFVFGSDWPMADPAREMQTIRGLGLSEPDVDAVLGGTLAGLLGLDPDLKEDR